MVESFKCSKKIGVPSEMHFFEEEEPNSHTLILKL